MNTNADKNEVTSNQWAKTAIDDGVLLNFKAIESASFWSSIYKDVPSRIRMQYIDTKCQ